MPYSIPHREHIIMFSLFAALTAAKKRDSDTFMEMDTALIEPCSLLWRQTGMTSHVWHANVLASVTRVKRVVFRRSAMAQILLAARVWPLGKLSCWVCGSVMVASHRQDPDVVSQFGLLARHCSEKLSVQSASTIPPWHDRGQTARNDASRQDRKCVCVCLCVWLYDSAFIVDTLTTCTWSYRGGVSLSLCFWCEMCWNLKDFWSNWVCSLNKSETMNLCIAAPQHEETL